MLHTVLFVCQITIRPYISDIKAPFLSLLVCSGQKNSDHAVKVIKSTLIFWHLSMNKLLFFVLLWPWKLIKQVIKTKYESIKIRRIEVYRIRKHNTSLLSCKLEISLPNVLTKRKKLATLQAWPNLWMHRMPTNKKAATWQFHCLACPPPPPPPPTKNK